MREAFPRGLRREAIAFRFARGDDTADAPATRRKGVRGVGRCPPPPRESLDVSQDARPFCGRGSDGLLSWGAVS